MAVRGASARRAGHQFERDVANYLGVPTTRSVRPGIHDDAGDLVVPDWVVECKNHMTPSRNAIAAWLTNAQGKALDRGHAAVVLKARSQPLGMSRVVMSTSALADLLRVPLPADTPPLTTLVTIDLSAFRSFLTLNGVIGHE